jgi:hypothetical protein
MGPLVKPHLFTAIGYQCSAKGQGRRKLGLRKPGSGMDSWNCMKNEKPAAKVKRCCSRIPERKRFAITSPPKYGRPAGGLRS